MDNNSLNEDTSTEPTRTAITQPELQPPASIPEQSRQGIIINPISTTPIIPEAIIAPTPQPLSQTKPISIQPELIAPTVTLKKNHIRRIFVIILAISAIIAGVYYYNQKVSPIVGSAARTFEQISVGANQACGISSDSLAYCWGMNDFSQLGNDNSYSYTKTPVAVYNDGALKGKTIKAISAGNKYSCAIASDDQVYCWGGGRSNSISYYKPIAVDATGMLSGKTIKAISSNNTNGSRQTCAIASDDQVYCWEWDPSDKSALTPILMSNKGALSGKTIKAVSVGNGYSCVIASDDQSYCWAKSNKYGVLGNGGNIDSTSPVAVDTTGVLNGKTITSISPANASCVVASDKHAYCWGGVFINEVLAGNHPISIDTSGALNGKTIKSISVGDAMSYCVIDSDDKAYCAGNHVGNSSVSDATGPTAINTKGALAGKTIKSILTSYQRGCVLTSDNHAYCWSENETGTGSTDPEAI